MVCDTEGAAAGGILSTPNVQVMGWIQAKVYIRFFFLRHKNLKFNGTENCFLKAQKCNI